MSQFNALITSAWHYIKANNPKQAMEAAKAAHAQSPDSPEVAHILGLLASRDGHPEIALPLLQKSIDLGGKSERKLRDMAEALFSAGHAQHALVPLDEAIQLFGESSELLGLRSAIAIDLTKWSEASAAAQKAIALNPQALVWELNLSFSALMQQDFVMGFKHATARNENIQVGARSPVCQFATPCEVWLKGEQGPGDTLYYLRFVPPLVALGWRFHLEVEHKLIPLLAGNPNFLSVKDKNPCPKQGFWLNVGDLALMAQQCGVVLPKASESNPQDNLIAPLSLSPQAQLVEKYKKELEKIGPAPYIAVTWRGGPRGRKQRQGVRMLEKCIPPEQLGAMLRNTSATIINIQRVPNADEAKAFYQALGRKVADYSALNNNLAGMLALLSLVDEYVTVSNTNLHLREALGKPSQVFVNRPFQDWRWLAQGQRSPWYPQSTIYRQAPEGDWQVSFEHLQDYLVSKQLIVSNQLIASKQLLSAQLVSEKAGSKKTLSESPAEDASNKEGAEATLLEQSQDLHKQTIAEGWEVVSTNIPLAIKKAQTVLAQQPDHPRALHLLAWAAVQDIKFEMGLQLLKKACELAPTDSIIWRDYIRALSLNGQVTEAIQVAEQCIANPNMRSKSALYYAKAGAHYKCGQDLEALAAYDACLKISPNNIQALGFAGMLRIKLGKGHARLGFKQYSGRAEAQHPNNAAVWFSPVLKGDIKGLNILITRDMGLGDELSYLRYLPWLLQTGANVTYWCGAKLKPILARSFADLPPHQFNSHQLIVVPDNQPMPDPANFDLAFIVNELPAAVEHYDAPEIAAPLPLTPNLALVEKWQAWLKQQGEAPYIGFNWRAGVANAEKTVSFAKLAKAVEPIAFSKALNGVKATWVSLQRNVTKAELAAFTDTLGAPIHDASGLTDDLDDLLALLSVLDDNVGVSNTNMHLRAGLGLASKVLVQYPGGDWRWGTQGKTSQWFTQSKVYRQGQQGDWQPALAELHADLIEAYGQVSQSETLGLSPSQQTVNAEPADKQGLQQTNKIIWLTGGNFIQDEQGNMSSVVASTRNRVLAPAKGLESLGWVSDYINESFSQTMGGWGQCIPQKGDTVVISKVFTDHAIKLAKDAKARGAQVIVDFCDNFLDNPKRAPLQRALVEQADKIVCSETSIAEAFSNIAQQSVSVIESLDLDNINQDLVALWQSLITSTVKKNAKNQTTYAPLTANTVKRVLVGMMYSGEQEYEQAKLALSNQTHQNYELFEVKNLPNKLAHDTLYAKFMERASEFSYFLKLDADMVFAHEQVLAEMVENIASKNYAHLFAYVKDCPSNLMIPGIQMFRSDTQWLGSDEQLNVDYFPKLYGDGNLETNQNWILHMPNPSRDQLFRYGIHKALKAIQPQLDSRDKSQRKAILHINILAGIARNLEKNPDLRLSLMGATLVFSEQFSSIEYNGDIAKSYFEKLQNDKFYSKLESLSQTYWANEIQIYYKWLELFNKNNPQLQVKSKASAEVEVAPVELQSTQKPTNNIVWITAGTLDTSQGYVNSNFASTRYRVLIPAANLGVHGWKSQIVNEDDLVNHGWDKLNLNSGDTVIVSKSLNPALIKALQQAKAKGCRVIVDFCDNHFERPAKIGQHQNNLLRLADVVTTCSPQLKQIIESKSKATVKHITDSFEGQKKTATFSVATPANLLWFGNQINFDTLYPLLDALRIYSKKTPINLNIVTLIPDGESVAKTLSQEKLTVQYTPWSQQNLTTAMQNCDMVVIPTLKNENKSVKSPNRIIEPLWAGKYVVAGNLPAYEPFAPFAGIGDDLIAGIEWAMNHPQEVLDRIKAGQAYIAANHTPKFIGEQWHEVLTEK